jgi:hydrogenase expression/formation protein HypD
MKYVSEFRDSKLVKKLSEKIKSLDLPDKVNFMEVCGTHTMSIYRYGIKSLLPPFIKLTSGPGCPVCVSEVTYIDKAIALTRDESDLILASFGDLLRVPGSHSSLQKEKAMGADVRIVYSSMDSVKLAQKNPDKHVVFLGVGFETTSPTIGASIMQAHRLGLKNYSVLTSHKTMPEAMKTLLDMEDIKIDGFICPAHVSVVIGKDAYGFIPENYGKPCVITGFEPVDIMEGILMLCEQIKKGKPDIENQYYRVVQDEGNKKMQEIMFEVFEQSDANWRGIGVIKRSGLTIRDKYKMFDAEKRFDIKPGEPQEFKACICGEVLVGRKHPKDCPLFGKICNPSEPKGACMVSDEGNCSSYFKYGSHEYNRSNPL